jgi:hypothetical protein
LKYRFLGKEKTLSIGLYLDVSLSDARNARDNARKQLADKIDPGLAKQVSKRSAKEAAENSCEMIAREWFTKCSPKWSPSHGERILRGPTLSILNGHVATLEVNDRGFVARRDICLPPLLSFGISKSMRKYR